MEFLDRVDEKERLRKALDRKGTSLIVLYGRRRIGKSELIKRVLNDDDIYFMADKTDQAQQRHLFAMSLSSKFPNFDRINFATGRPVVRVVLSRAACSAIHCMPG